VKDLSISEFASFRNASKALFTAGPASLLPENIVGLRPCFGRGDKDYEEVENNVLLNLKKISGHEHVLRLQGSASLAGEIAALNFLYGKVLIVSTGYYSERLNLIAQSASRSQGNISEIRIVNWEQLHEIRDSFDWMVSCVTETSRGLLLPVRLLSDVARRIGARLFLDATASIGLESGHELADVIFYSSCKGLFGLTGAAFIAFNEIPPTQVDSFYLSLETHMNKRVTGPYHSICSLHEVLPRHSDFSYAVGANKAKFLELVGRDLVYEKSHQPQLCTLTRRDFGCKDDKVIMYDPRGDTEGSVVCHLGEVHLAQNSQGKIFDLLGLVE
jgi:aspartate aminotransferase-like enzyme